MKVRNTKSEGEKIELQMTPMIDIVFQLLVFFIMTFNIVKEEGDFNITMPAAAISESNEPPPEEELPFVVHMHALPGSRNLDLTRFKMNEVPLGGAINPSSAQARADNEKAAYERLTKEMIAHFGNDTGPESATRKTTEVELNCDPDLKYQYVIKAITAVSGHVDNKQLVKLVEKIKFRDRTGG